jgi:hypothetical protein
MTITLDQARTAHAAATDAGLAASLVYADQHFNGKDGGCCGFAWATFTPKNKGNTKLGKAERKLFEQIGYRKDYTGKAWQCWNPAQWGGQSIDAKFNGAVAYAKKFTELTGVHIGVGERVD